MYQHKSVEAEETGYRLAEWQQAVDQLRLTRLIVEQSPTVVFRWRASPGWPATYVSENVRQWGYSAAEMLAGALPFDLLVHPADLVPVSAEIRQHISQGTENFPLQFRVLAKDREIRWVEVLASVERDAAGRAEFLQGIVTDITARRIEEAKLRERARRGWVQSEALGAIAVSPALAAGDIKQFSRELTEAAAGALGVERANVWLFDDTETELHCVDLYEATAGKHSAGAVLTSAQYHSEFQALKESSFVDASDAQHDPRTAGYVEDYLRPLGITSMLDALVSVSGKHLGVVCLEHMGRPHHWQPDEIAFACRLADKVGLALSNRQARRATNQWHASLEQAIRAIANTVEVRDPYTAGHQAQVAELSGAIARELGLAEDRIRGLVLAASIHDVGKAQVPADILNKPGVLNHHELQFIRTHPEVGHSIVKDIDFPWPIAEYVRQHHERLDGSGYPQGLKGEAILLEARIIAVADTIEAMTSHRPYRPALGIDAALAEIQAGAGRLFDADVVQACLRLFHEDRFAFSPARA
jgi:PAS domain S-box-containing protein/putative nucleotidyltransferase with HDIG domain